MSKKILGILFIIVGVWALWQHELIYYGFSQAKGQLKIIFNARPVEDVLNDPAVADSLKQKIHLVQEIREYAIDSLGLSDSDSYHTLYDQHGKPVLWVVTACEPFSLEDKTWEFPLLGSFSYKGFFEHEKAVREKNALKAEGYDTGIRTVSAWSTLGFLDDPIMSGILFNNVGSLTNTIIHELTHGTVFVKDNLKFNENLASFVGHQGALSFLKYKYGEASPEYTYYDTYMSDKKRFVAHMLKGTERLDSLYQSFSANMDVKTKAGAKENLIREIMHDLDTVQFENKHYRNITQKLLQKDSVPNNTYFKSYIRYQSKMQDLEKKYAEQYDNNLKAFLAYLKDEYQSI